MMMGTSVNSLESSIFLGVDEPEMIDTRFGKIALQKHNSIMFSHGLLGMPNKFNFFLTEFPSPHMRKFKLLQCLDDLTLSFITLPVDLQNTIISTEDLSSACNDLGFSIANLVTLLIVSVHRTPGKLSLSVNARAPLLIDSGKRIAAQHVFQTDKYKVQHTITT